MTPDFPVYYLARLVLQTTTPLSIGLGRSDGIFDTALVRDANDLPAIPGSSLAGVLRHIYAASSDETAASELFGSATKGHEQPSRLQVSWGCLHDSEDRPAEGLLLGKERDRLSTDPLFADARQAAPLVRNHVRLTHRGTAKHQGQFDRTALRSGHRFSVELSLWSQDAADSCWAALLDLLNRPDFRLGGASRRGLGGLKVERFATGVFDLRQPADFTRFGQVSTSLAATELLTPTDVRQLADHLPVATLKLTPEDFYRFGQGTEPLGPPNDEPDIQLLPVTEKKVVWQDNHGRLSAPRVLIPASAVKGALAHRVAFHCNALEGRFAEDLCDEEIAAYDPGENAAVRALFGFARDDRKNEHTGQAGRVTIDDCLLSAEDIEPVRLVHNSIDRFTGGVRDRVLFSEQVVSHETPIVLHLTITDPEEIRPLFVRRSLQRALEDLAKGRLALGGGSARGHGFFRGTVTWNRAGARWIKGEDDES